MRETLLKLRAELQAMAEAGDESAAIVELDPTAVLCIDCASKLEQ